jgi:hypothetical protein
VQDNVQDDGLSLFPAPSSFEPQIDYKTKKYNNNPYSYPKKAQGVSLKYLTVTIRVW